MRVISREDLDFLMYLPMGKEVSKLSWRKRENQWQRGERKWRIGLKRKEGRKEEEEREKNEKEKKEKEKEDLECGVGVIYAQMKSALVEKE